MVDFFVRIVQIVPERGREEVGGDGLYEDPIVVPEKVEAWVLVYDDLAGVRCLVVQREYVPVVGRLYLEKLLTSTETSRTDPDRAGE